METIIRSARHDVLGPLKADHSLPSPVLPTPGRSYRSTRPDPLVAGLVRRGQGQVADADGADVELHQPRALPIVTLLAKTRRTSRKRGFAPSAWTTRGTSPGDCRRARGSGAACRARRPGRSARRRRQAVADDGDDVAERLGGGERPAEHVLNGRDLLRVGRLGVLDGPQQGELPGQRRPAAASPPPARPGGPPRPERPAAAPTDTSRTARRVRSRPACLQVPRPVFGQPEGERRRLVQQAEGRAEAGQRSGRQRRPARPRQRAASRPGPRPGSASPRLRVTARRGRRG